MGLDLMAAKQRKPMSPTPLRGCPCCLIYKTKLMAGIFVFFEAS